MWIAVDNLCIKNLEQKNVDKHSGAAKVIHNLSTWQCAGKGLLEQGKRKSLTDYPHIHRAYY